MTWTLLLPPSLIRPFATELSLRQRNASVGSVKTMGAGAIIGDPRFIVRCRPHSLATVAETACSAAPSIGLQFTSVALLQTAGPDEVSFLDNRRYALALEATSAGAAIMHPDMLPRVPEGTVPIVTTEPYAG